MSYIYLYVVLMIMTSISFIYYLVNSYGSVFYSNPKREFRESDLSKVTIVIPVYNEDKYIFREVIESVAKQRVKFLVVGDSSYEPYKSITEKNGGTFVHIEERRGKRNALSTAIKLVETEYVFFVDSDTTLPDDAVKGLMSSFDGTIGGVGANISVRINGAGVSYSSEFMERAREVVLRAMSSHGSVMVLDGKCAMYRTDLIKPLLTSQEFINHRVLGKSSIIGDDQQMSGYIIRKGYKAIKNYDVVAKTESPDDFKKFIKQQVRWSRSSYVYFFKNLFNGTARRAGWFYVFEACYTFMLPILALSFGIFRFYLELSSLGHQSLFMISHLEDLLLINFTRVKYIFLTRIVVLIMNAFGTTMFASAVVSKISKERLKTLGFGAVALGILFFTSLYGLLTFWKQSKWLTR